MRLKGISTTKASPLLRTSIKIRTVGDERDGRPGAIEADTVAHCGPSFVGEFARFPFPLVSFDSDNGSEFINHDVAEWLQAREE
jgi:hypothetical protein